MASRKPEIKSLYYITHVGNLPSIFQRGILAHRRVEESGLPFTPIYDAAIVSHRESKRTPDDRSLWDFANVYFQPRNPMLYRVLHEKDATDVAVIGVSTATLNVPASFVALGNAASAATEILPAPAGLARLGEIWSAVTSDWWNPVDGSKRKIMAECLVPDAIAPAHILSVFVASHAAADKVRAMGAPRSVPVIPEPHMFFQPARRIRITERISLVEGDMFFSTMQTLTVSVNVVGIMGKGLASRAKYQFPDVYVVYQDACRAKRLRMGHPFLYKRESLVDQELAEDPGSLPGLNANKWFLLFATKKHWRDDSDLAAIEEGLRWLTRNYKSEGIKSLALPALGCGLGRLEWRDVGPLMCRELSALDVPVAIYLPREREIAGEYLTSAYLLAG
jgi:O-acetyl-ADP-ribose deacetylase (regulator of RNase III)